MWHLKKIPKILHLYWGNDRLSFLRYLTVYSFRKFNPDWRIKVYHPRIKYRGKRTWASFEQSVDFTGQNYLEKLNELEIDSCEINFRYLGINSQIPETFKSDFFRWHILSTQGGIWSDFDIIYLKSIEDLFLNQIENQQLNTIICLDNSSKYPYHSIGFLLSSPGNSFFRYIYQRSRSCFNLQDYQSIGYTMLNRDFSHLNSIQQKFKNIKLANLNMTTVYPFSPAILFSDNVCEIPADTIGVHWYAGHPKAGRLENILTDKNYQEYNYLISKLITKVLK